MLLSLMSLWQRGAAEVVGVTSYMNRVVGAPAVPGPSGSGGIATMVGG